MASEKLRTGLELEIFTLGQVAKKLHGIPSKMQSRILNLLLAASRDGVDDDCDNRQEDTAFG